MAQWAYTNPVNWAPSVYWYSYTGATLAPLQCMHSVQCSVCPVYTLSDTVIGSGHPCSHSGDQVFKDLNYLIKVISSHLRPLTPALRANERFCTQIWEKRAQLVVKAFRGDSCLKILISWSKPRA